MLLVALFAGLATSAIAQNYQKNLTKELKKILGKEFKKNNFVFRQVPFDNFGLLSAFKDEIEFASFQCDMFTCIDKTIPTDFPSWLSMYGYAAVGNSHSTMELDKKVQNGFAINMALPKLLSVLGINADLNNKNIKDIRLNLGNFYLRLAQPRKLTRFMDDTLKAGDPLKQLWDRGELVFVGGDVVAEYIDMEVVVDQNLESKLDAKISDTAKIANIGGSSMNFQYNRSSKGTYRFKVNAPVIIAYMPRKQSGAGALSVAGEKPLSLEEIANFYHEKTLDYNPALKKN